MDEQAARMLQRIRRTEVEMMRDRGYVMQPEDEEVLAWATPPTAQSFIMFYNSLRKTIMQRGISNSIVPALDRVYTHAATGKLCGIFHAEDDAGSAKIGVETMRRMIMDASPVASEHPLIKKSDGTRLRLSSVIFVTSAELGPYSGPVLAVYNEMPYQHLVFDNLVINPTRCILVPKYTHISAPAEIAEILKRNRVKPAQLPLIREEDPISRYYGARHGDLFIEEVDLSFFPQPVKTHELLRIVVRSN